MAIPEGKDKGKISGVKYACNYVQQLVFIFDDGAAKLSLGIITADQVLSDCIELIKTDPFIRLDKLGRRHTKKHLRARTYLTKSVYI